MKIPNLLEIRQALLLGKEEGHLADGTFSILKERGKVEQFLAAHPRQCERLREAAEHPLPLNALTYRLYRQFDTEGKRQEYEGVYFARRERMKLLTLCGYFYQDVKYYEELQDVIWEICNEYTWCLPAHLGGTSLTYLPSQEQVSIQNGKIVPYPYPHRHRLDLFACETAKELAETLRAAGESIAENVRDRVVSEIADRVFSQYLTFNSLHGFETDVSNWSAVCGASIGIAALYLMDEPELLAPVIQRVISDLDVFVGSYGEDGIGREGVEYWDFGFSNFCMFADLLKERTGGRLNLFADEKVKRMAYFPSRAYVFQDHCINFSDCEDHCSINRALLAYLKAQYPDMPAPTLCSVPEWENMEKLPALRDIFWTYEWNAPEFAERSEFFEDTQWLISCQNTTEGSRSFVIKGGTNAEPHNHNDLGSFILMLNEETFLCELGRGLYTKDYFGEQRYSYLVNAARGHSVPMIDGTEQAEGKGRRAKVQTVQMDETQDMVSLDLTDAYDCVSLKQYTRKAVVLKRRSEIRLQEYFEFATSSGEIRERFISKMRPKIRDGEILLKGRAACLHISCLQSDVEILVQEESYADFRGESQTAYCMDFLRKRENLKEELEFVLKFEPIRELQM